MNWIYSKRYFDSEKNGRIKVRRLLGQYTIVVGYTMETSPYTTTMWRLALRHVTKNARVKSILMLGLGGAGSIAALLKKYPHARITVLEWDPTMLEICQKLNLIKHRERVDIHIGDARHTTKALTQKFDLIIFDLVCGKNISEAITDHQFLQDIANRLAPNGYFLVNYFSEQNKSKYIEEHFLHQESWRYRYNALALYRPQLPADYEKYRANIAFIQRESKIVPDMHMILSGDRTGTRHKVGFIYSEKYLGNKEPPITPFEHLRLIHWQPTVHTACPPGWHKSWLQMGTRSYGLAHITNPEHYWEHWSNHALRQRKKWETEQVKWEIGPAAEDDFFKAFVEVRYGLGLSRVFVNIIKHKIRAHGPLVKLFAARLKGTTPILAGLAVLHTPECSTSTHVAAFHLPEARNGPVGTGLIDTWYKEAISQNIRFLDFGVVRANGEPRSWKGYSDFKNQFLTHTAFNPKPFFKFVRKVK